MLRSVKWGGNPHDKPMVPGPNGLRLTPRRSFELFSDSVHGHSVPWLQWEIELALRFRLVVMQLVSSRAEQLTELNLNLARSNDDLDAFAYVASHDLKEPLRGMHKYAHQLAESAALADPQDTQRVEGLIRLTLRMDSLLDSLLHFSRVGRVALELEDVDLDELVHEALEMVVARHAAARDRNYRHEANRSLHDMASESILIHMKTTLNIDDHLLEEARRLTRIDEKTALVRAGLEALIARESARRLAALAGSEPELVAGRRRRASARATG